MDEIILQLTHDNDLFAAQWSDTFDRIERAAIPNDCKVILNALANYVLAEPMDSSPFDVKYLFVTMVIKQLINHQGSIELTDLVHIFTYTLDRSRTDQWNLNFLQVVYENFKIGEQLSLTPLKTNLIEQILQSLHKKKFIFNSEQDQKKWERFLTRSMFSNSINNDNILNKQTIITNMQTNFQQFYQHAIEQSRQSPIWLQIATILHESSPKIFILTTTSSRILSDTNLSINTISSDYLKQLIQSYKNNIELIKTHYTELLTMIERLILTNRYDDVHLLLSKVIIPNLSAIDLENLLCKLIHICPIVEQRDLFASQILSPLVDKLEDLKVKKNLSFIYFDFILAILKLHTTKAPDLVNRLLRRKDFYSWKELINNIIHLIQTCISYDTIIHKETFSDLDKLEDIIDYISEKAEVYPTISKALHSIAVEAVIRWSNSGINWGNHVYRMGTCMRRLINLEQINEDVCIRFIDALQNRTNSQNEELNNKNRAFFIGMASQLGDFIEQLKRLSNNVHSKLATLFLCLLDHPFYDENEHMTFEHVTLATTILRTATSIFNEKDARLYEPYLDRMYNDARNDEKTVFYQWWIGFWLIMGTKISNVAKDHIEQFLEYTFNSKDMSLIGLLVTLCIQRSDLLHTHFDKLIDTLISDEGQYLSPFTSLFSLTVNQHPKIVLSKHLDQIFSSLETIPFNNDLCLFIQSLSSVANYHPYLFDIHREKLVRLIHETQNSFIFQCFQKYIVASSLINDESKVNEHLTLLIELFKDKNCSKQIQKDILYTCLLIGLKYKPILINRRQEFVTVESNLLLNYIDNTLINDIDQTIIDRARNDLQQIELCIDRTKINNQEEKQNIPSWATEVTKLLNHRSSNDWRLLSKQLGFSSSEIKHWAMQTDPSMVLLNEWFTTHTADEAVYSLVKVLGEISRQDVEQIIRQALLTTGQIIPNNLSIDIKRLPPICLSFHSSELTLISKLKVCLVNSGYACQMYDEKTELNTMETSIRGAKLVVCCINTHYLQSENCPKVFQLILSLKKPFLLIHTEKQTESSYEVISKSIFDDYSYIQFSDHKNNENWPENKFIELLSQIRYHIAPDHDIISEEYRHWFIPRLDHLIFLKSSNKQHENRFISLNDVPLVVLHPQIIISYQWDCQQDALYLYKQLTQLGYRIWLNIFQMAGGDTLTEKYHIAIQQALCLLVCITPKYMKSTTCQHELSQAITLKKPVIPLLLEETNSWPPANLVLPVFSEKPYIDFQHSNGYDRWIGKQFEMLLTQLKQIVPNVQPNKPRYLLEMQRPVSASRTDNNIDQRPKRISSAPSVPNSRACSLM